MAVPPRDPDESQAASTRRGIRWDALSAIIASLVGLLALLVAGYTAYIQRQQVRAQVWPYMELGDETSIGSATESKNFVALLATNKGVGPAIVRRVEILANGRPQPDIHGILKAVGVDAAGADVSHSTFDGTVLSPGETTKFLVVSGESGATEFSAGIKDLIMRACYSSTLGEHWMATTDFHEGRHGVRSVVSCALIPKADEYHD